MTKSFKIILLPKHVLNTFLFFIPVLYNRTSLARPILITILQTTVIDANNLLTWFGHNYWIINETHKGDGGGVDYFEGMMTLPISCLHPITASGGRRNFLYAITVRPRYSLAWGFNWFQRNFYYYINIIGVDERLKQDGLHIFSFITHAKRDFPISLMMTYEFWWKFVIRRKNIRQNIGRTKHSRPC